MHIQLRWNWRHLLVVLVKKNIYFSQKKPFSERGPPWSNKTFILVKKNLFLCPPAACIPSLGGCPLHSGSTLVKKTHFYSSKKTFSCVHRGRQPQEMYIFLSMQSPSGTVLGAGHHRSARPVPVPGGSCLYGAFRVARPIWWHTVQ